MPVIHLDRGKDAEVSREQLFEAAAAMPTPELDKFIDDLMTARAKQYAQSLPGEEAALLERINRGLSQTKWQRFHELQARQSAESITETDRAELLRLLDEIEEFNVARIEALARLSKVRGVPLPTLMETLGIKPPGYV